MRKTHGQSETEREVGLETLDKAERGRSSLLIAARSW